MRRFSTISLEEPLQEPDELDESGLSSDARQERIKLGTAWSIATVTGLAALGYSTMSQASRTSTMLGLMGLLLAYAGYGSFLKKKNPLQFADSLYYMGFLWALFGLIATFVLWPAPRLTVDAVLTTFGYALVTTFSGMLLRVVVIQFQDTPSDRRVHAQEAIDRRTAALTRQIQDATTDITAFRDRAVSELGGTLQDLVRSLRDVRDKIAEQHRTMTTRLSADFEASLKDVLGRLAAVQVPQDILTTEVVKLVAALGKQGEDVEQAVHKLEQSVMQAADHVTRFGDSLYGSEAATRMGAAVNALSTMIKERTDELATMTSTLGSSHGELERQLESVQSLRSAIAKVSAQLSALEAELTDLSSPSLSAEVRSGLVTVQKAIQSSVDASQAIETTMRGVMGFLKQRVTEERPVDGQ